MSNALFPQTPLICKGLTTSSSWLTDVQTAGSGREVAVAKRTYPVYSFKLPLSRVRSSAAFVEYQTIQAFINARSGRADSFLFKHPFDNWASAFPLGGVGDGVTTTFQILRNVGGWLEPVGGVDAATFAPLVNGAVAGSYSLGANLDQITFATPPASGAVLTWSGVYFFRVRLLKDDTQFAHANGQYASLDLDLRTCRL